MAHVSFFVCYSGTMWYNDYSGRYSSDMFRSDIVRKVTEPEDGRARRSALGTYSKGIGDHRYSITIGYDKAVISSLWLTLEMNEADPVRSLLEGVKRILDDLHELDAYIAGVIAGRTRTELRDRILLLGWQTLSSYLEEDDIREFTEAIGGLVDGEARPSRMTVYSRGGVRSFENNPSPYMYAILTEAVLVQEIPLPMAVKELATLSLRIHDLYYAHGDLGREYLDVRNSLSELAKKCHLGLKELRNRKLTIEADCEELRRRAYPVIHSHEDFRIDATDLSGNEPTVVKIPLLPAVVKEMGLSYEGYDMIADYKEGRFCDFSLVELNGMLEKEQTRSNSLMVVIEAAAMVIGSMVIGFLGYITTDFQGDWLGLVANTLQLSTFFAVLLLLVLRTRNV